MHKAAASMKEPAESENKKVKYYLYYAFCFSSST